MPVVIAHEHNWSYTGDPLRVWLDREVIGRLASRFIAVSEISRRRMIEFERITPNKIIVMPTAYIPHDQSPGSDIRAELGIAQDTPLIAAAAGLRPEKALDVMLDAHAKVRDRIGAAHLAIAGCGPCRRDLELQARRLGLQDSVHLLGERRDVDSILQAADVGAMSSDWEGMPLFVFECMAARLPLVATTVGGLPEVVEPGTTGLLVPPRDADALAAGLVDVLTDPAFGARMAAAAAERLSQFTIEHVANRFADLYDLLMDEARAV